MSEPVLKPYRDQIDNIDDQIIALFKQRFDVVKEVIQTKLEHDIPVVIPDRINEVVKRAAKNAGQIGLPEDFAEGLYHYVIDYTCQHENKALGRNQES